MKILQVSRSYEFEPEFIFNALLVYLRGLLLKSAHTYDYTQINNYFGVDCKTAIISMISGLSVGNDPNYYIYELNTTGYVGQVSNKSILNAFISGNLGTIRRFTSITYITKLVADNIYYIYDSWENGGRGTIKYGY